MAEGVWEAQERQAEFLRREEDEVLFGGAAGGGKTDSLLIYAIKTCVEHPGAQALFLRRTFADLDKPGSAIQRSHQLLQGVAEWDGQRFRWNFKHGSVLAFGHLQRPTDMYAYQGAQVDVLCWDELTQFEEEQYQFLRMRVRATVEGVRPRIRAGTNPGGIGHAWVKRRWVDAAPWGEAFELQDGSHKTACFIPAKVEDNQALLARDPGYADRLAGLPEHMRRAYLEGDWDIFAGQVFSEWRRDRHVVKPFAVPSEWRRWRGYDYGYSQPMACLWFAKAESGTVYVYRELYGSGLTDVQQARRIGQMSEGEVVRYTVGDPSCWSRQPSGKTIADVLGEGGVSLRQGNNDRLAGWQRVHEYLACDEGHEPKLQIFEGCRNLLRELPGLVYDMSKVEDVDTTLPDHAADALRYGLMAASARKAVVRSFPFEVVSGEAKAESRAGW